MKDTFRALLPGYMQADIDIGEMFLNFLLHESMKKLSGVDVNHIGPKGKDGKRIPWERWVRNWMGLKDSPFRSVQWMIRLKFEVYGDKDDENNPFQYDRVELNLPGSKNYRPDLPWVMKIRVDGELASEIFVYVDDGRVTAHNSEACWAACRRFASKCSEKGVQDASRKRTTPTTTPGSWAGTNTTTDNGTVSATVSKERWEKTQAQVKELDVLVELADEDGGIPLKRLLSIRGYLQYVCRTYDWLTPYMKGLHLTVDSWREWRDEEGWKYSPSVMAKMKQALAEEDMKIPCRRSEELDEGTREVEAELTPPERVKVVPRMIRDVKAMLELTNTVHPPKDAVRAAKNVLALYLPGDASGDGFGTAIISEDEGIMYEAAMWKTSYAKESSNFREAFNLVKKLIELIGGGKMGGREIFLITDNLVFESCYYKGYSDSQKLTDIIFDLRKAQRDGGVIGHVIHVSGTRMKEMGIDDLSRGKLMDGIMAGKDPVSFLPFDKGANERSKGKVKRWIDDWWKDWDGGPLVEMGKDLWFESRHVKGARLWMPPPAAMRTIMEVFNEDRIADMKTTHIFAVPRLMTHLWRKKLIKRADVMFTVQTGNHFWEKSQHEPLIIAIVFPLSHVPNYRGPWIAKGSHRVDVITKELEQGFKYHKANGAGEFPELERGVRRLWEQPERRSRDLLQQLLATTRSFPPVHECLVRRVLHSGRKRSFSPTAGTGRSGGGKRPSVGGSDREESLQSGERR